MKKNKTIWIYIACVIVLVAIILSTIIILNKTSEGHKWKEKKVYVDKEEFFKTENMMAKELKWEESSITQKFYTVYFLDKQYDAKHKKIDRNLIGEGLGTAELTGYDYYTGATYKINANIYEIKDFPTKCVVAVRFEDDADYYPYINAYYTPRTLGEFINDLNLKETVEFGSVWYADSYNDKDGNYHYDKIEFPDVPDDIIWQMLLSDETLKNVHDDNTYHSEIMSISVNIPIFGYENIGITISEDGYLTTNIFETGKTFYIGEEKVEEFVNYVLDKYDGYKTIYVDENGKEINENEYLDEQEPGEGANEIIMVYQNGVVEPYEANISGGNGKNYTEAYNPGN